MPSILLIFLALSPSLLFAQRNYQWCDIGFRPSDKISKTSALPGEVIELYGKWGDSQGEKLAVINRGEQNKLEVLSWSPSTIRARIPDRLQAGTYGVGVYCNDPHAPGKGGAYSGGFIDFEVKGKQAGLQKLALPDGRVVWRSANPYFWPWAAKVLCFAVLFLWMKKTMANPAGKFPQKTDARNPFVGAVANFETVQASAVDDKLVLSEKAAYRWTLGGGGVIFGPGMIYLMASQPKDLARMPAPVQWLVAFFCAIGGMLFLRSFLRSPRVEISKFAGEWRFFLGSGAPIFLLPGSDIKGIEDTQQVYVSDNRSPTYHYRAVSILTAGGERIALCAIGEAAAPGFLERLRASLPAGEPPSRAAGIADSVIGLPRELPGERPVPASKYLALTLALAAAAAPLMVWRQRKASIALRLSEPISLPAAAVAPAPPAPLVMTSQRQEGEMEFYASEAGKIYMRGLEHENKSEHDAALKDFDEAIRLNPKIAAVYDSRAGVFEVLRKDEESLKDRNEAIFLKPGDPTYHFGRGMLLANMGRLAEAEADCERLKALDPGAAASLCDYVKGRAPR